MARFLGIDFGHREYVHNVTCTKLAKFDLVSFLRMVRQKRVNYMLTNDIDAYMLYDRRFRTSLQRPFRIQRLTSLGLKPAQATVEEVDYIPIKTRLSALTGISKSALSIISYSTNSLLNLREMLYLRFRFTFPVPSASIPLDEFYYDYDTDKFYDHYGTTFNYSVNMIESPFNQQALDEVTIPITVDNYIDGKYWSYTKFERVDFGWVELILTSVGGGYSIKTDFTLADVILGESAMYASNIVEMADGRKVYKSYMYPRRVTKYVYKNMLTGKVELYIEKYPITVDLERVVNTLNRKFYPIKKVDLDVLNINENDLSKVKSVLENSGYSQSGVYKYTTSAIERQLADAKKQETMLTVFGTSRDTIKNFIQQDDENSISVSRFIPLTTNSQGLAQYLYEFFDLFNDSVRPSSAMLSESTYPNQAVADCFNAVCTTYFNQNRYDNSYSVPNIEIKFEIDTDLTRIRSQHIGFAFNKDTEFIPNATELPQASTIILKLTSSNYESNLINYITDMYNMINGFSSPSQYVLEFFEPDTQQTLRTSTTSLFSDGDILPHDGQIQYSDIGKMLDVLHLEARYTRRLNGEDTVRSKNLYAFVNMMKSLGAYEIADDTFSVPDSFYKTIMYFSEKEKDRLINLETMIPIIASNIDYAFSDVALYEIEDIQSVSTQNNSSYASKIIDPTVEFFEVKDAIRFDVQVPVYIGESYNTDFEAQFNESIASFVKEKDLDKIDTDSSLDAGFMQSLRDISSAKLQLYKKSDDGITVITISNLELRMYVNDRVVSTKRLTSSSRNDFAIPLDLDKYAQEKKSLNAMNIFELATTSPFVISSYTTSYYVKWYQEDWVGPAIQVIGLIVMFATAGAGTPVVEIVKQIVIQIAIQQLAMMIANSIGGQFGAILGAIVVAAGSVYNPATGSYDFIKAISSVELWSKFSSAYLGFNNKVMLEESRHVIEALQHDIKSITKETLELKEKDKALDDSNMVNILEIPTLQRPSFNYNVNIVDEEQYGALDNRTSIDDELFEVQDFMDRALLE